MTGDADGEISVLSEEGGGASGMPCSSSLTATDFERLAEPHDRQPRQFGESAR